LSLPHETRNSCARNGGQLGYPTCHSRPLLCETRGRREVRPTVRPPRQLPLRPGRRLRQHCGKSQKFNFHALVRTLPPHLHPLEHAPRRQIGGIRSVQTQQFQVHGGHRRDREGDGRGTSQCSFQLWYVLCYVDFPREAETYIHRAGRAGRFGKRGRCISFVTSSFHQKMIKNDTVVMGEAS
jgi:hypothetical protein